MPATYACLAFTERISEQRGEAPDAHVKSFPGIHSALVTMHLIRTHWSAFVRAHAFQSLSRARLLFVCASDFPRVRLESRYGRLCQ